jgi:L-ascorbate metabolism protein UlaG (beta-lactamase superfamily)
VETVDARRRRCAISVLGGPTTVVDIGGRRLVIDPTFDEVGEHGYLTKTMPPAAPAAALGDVDVVLVSHDQHPDNLDTAGRELASSVPLVITNPGAAARLGSRARGLPQWQSVELPAGDDVAAMTVTAVPAVHGPADGQRDDGGHVNCEVTGFVLSGPDLPTLYLSGDNAALSAVAEIADRSGPIDAAVLFVGAARVATKEGGRPLTLTSARAAAAAEVLGAKLVIPAHYDGWAHFSEDLDDISAAFAEAGIAAVLALAPHGSWIDVPVAG